MKTERKPGATAASPLSNEEVSIKTLKRSGPTSERRRKEPQKQPMSISLHEEVRRGAQPRAERPHPPDKSAAHPR